MDECGGFSRCKGLEVLISFAMDPSTHEIVQALWRHTVKARALCPSATETAIGITSYASPEWYRARGASYVVQLPGEMGVSDLQEMNESGSFINRSFVISLAAVLEESGVAPKGRAIDRSIDGGDHVQLIRWMRNAFAHGQWHFEAQNPDHVRIRSLFENLFPEVARQAPGFVISIDGVLEPLKDGALSYIRALAQRTA